MGAKLGAAESTGLVRRSAATPPVYELTAEGRSEVVGRAARERAQRGRVEAATPRNVLTEPRRHKKRMRGRSEYVIARLKRVLEYVRKQSDWVRTDEIVEALDIPHTTLHNDLRLLWREGKLEAGDRMPTGRIGGPPRAWKAAR